MAVLSPPWPPYPMKPGALEGDPDWARFQEDQTKYLEKLAEYEENLAVDKKSQSLWSRFKDWLFGYNLS